MSKKRVLAWVLTLAMIFTSMSWPSGIFTVTTAEAATDTVTNAEELTPEVTNNAGDQDYTSYYSSPMYSYLVSVDSGLMRVEYNGSEVVVEYYDSSYNLTSKYYVTAELSIFGGFYAGDDAYYLVFGQTNTDEDDSAEVIRVVKYSTSWVRQGEASLCGANTVQPFRSGSLRMDEYNGYLYIRTSHLMYTDEDDGLNHQANLTMVVKESDMSVVHSYYSVMNVSTGYVSHSFNQFIMIDDEGYIIAADHGDAYPRAAVLFKYNTKAGSSTVSTANTRAYVFTFQGDIGANATYASIGGLEYSSGYYLLAGNSVDQDDNYNSHTARNIFVTATSRSDFSTDETTVNWITDYDTDGDVTVSTPQLVKLGEDSFLLLWTVKSKDSSITYASQSRLNYVFLDGEGNTTSKIYEVEGQLSDCQPILAGDKVVWYVTGDVNSYSTSTEPIFYSIDLNGNFSHTETLEAPEFDVSTSTSGLEVTWNEIDGAEGYIVYVAYATSWVDTYTVSDADTTSYTVSDFISNGNKYYVWVEAYAGDTKSLVNEKKSIYYLKPILTPKSDSIAVSWGKISEASSYEVYRKTTGDYTKIATTTDTSWSDTNVTSGTTYTYQIKAICDDGDVYSLEISRTHLTTPVLISVENTSGGITATWGNVDGAEKYYVYVSKYVAYSIYASDDIEQTFTICPPSGTEYTFHIVAFSGTSQSAESNYITYMYLASPTVTLTTNDADIELSWDAVTEADEYEVYRKVENGSYVLMTTTTDTSYTDTDISADTFYTYQVYAYSGDYVSAGSTEKRGGVKDIEDCTITLSETSYTYDGSAKRPTVIVNDGTNELTSGTDYSLTYTDYIYPGTATITITGKGNYTGSITANYTINKKDQTITATIDSTTITYGESSVITSSGVGTKTYSSSDTSVATVSSSGRITAVGVGTATITVTAAGGTYYNSGTTTINVTVTKADQTVTASIANSSITYGGTSQITASGTGTISYSSSDTSVATVSSSGLVTATGVGTATITVTAAGNSNYNSATKTISVTVTKASQTLTASIASSSITYGGTSQITVSGTGTISYSSSNTSVATVSSSGLVTATGAGTATITVTAAGNSNYNSATKTISVTVTKASQTLTASIASSSITYGGTSQITASGTGTISYSSSNTSVATVSSSGLVTATGAGTVTITVTAAGNSNYNSATKTISVTVTKASQTLTVSIASSSITYGGTSQITASGTGTITYSSSDTSVATVSSSGLVTATGAGTATITVTAAGNSNYNSATKTISVTVTAASASYLLGDVNEDGEIDYLDAMTVLRYDAELITLDSTQLLAGDVNGDGAVDSLDAILILRYDADLIDSF